MTDLEYDHSVNATLDYGIDWSSLLGVAETISTSVWVVDTGLTKSLENIGGNITTLFVSGGVAGTLYKLKNTITTSGGRTDTRTIKLSCKNI